MELFKQYIINNFILFCIALVLIINSAIRYKQHPRISTYTILILSNTILISVMVYLTNVFKASGHVWGATITSMLSYDLRPICIFFIIMMTGIITPKNKWFPLLYIPLIINALVHCLMLIPAAKEFTISYEINDIGEASFFATDVFILRYFSHIIAGLYLAFLLYISFTKVNSKHIGHGMTIISCALFVVLAVVIESFFNENGDIEILNDTIAVSTLVYYLYLYIERTQIDTLTGLFNRETYYRDVHRLDNRISGVIQFDMNGLKYINDNYGHIEGDKALSTIANVISSCAKRNMYAYRLGGDEYIILCINGSEQDIIDTVTKFKEDIRKTGYYCSYGYYYRTKGEDISCEEMFKKAEEKMYEDKQKFYKNSPFERRKADGTK